MPYKIASFVSLKQDYLTFKHYVATLNIYGFRRQTQTVENISSAYKKDALGWSQQDQVCKEEGLPISLTDSPIILTLKLLQCEASHFSALQF